MFDLEQRLREWRRETEATLAFSSEELDELSDHLRLSFEAKLQDGLAPEEAWRLSLNGLGPASALAVEFAKEKLMPALVRLLTSWWQAGLLLFLCGAICSTTSYFSIGTTPDQGPKGPTQGYWVIAWLSLLVTLIFLRGKAQKNAVLAGVGNAFCLIPLLHVLFYNRLTEAMIGPGWSHMAASFGWLPVSLGLIGLFVLNLWWWKRGATPLEKLPEMLAVAGALILILALSPFASELIGNLSIRDVYQMPTASQVTFTPDVRNQFLVWKFDDVLVRSIIYIANFLPFVLTLVICAGVVMIQSCRPTVGSKSVARGEAFPSRASLPWIMALLGGGFCWGVGEWVNPPFVEQIRQAENGGFHPLTNWGGLESMILFAAFLFLICGYELTKGLARASHIRPFYAAMLVIYELTVVLPLPDLAPSEWLDWVLGLATVTMAFFQVLLIARKLRDKRGQISLWKFDGKELVELGLLLGLIFACCWLILYMVAAVMAVESVSVIGAMIAWGNSIKDPVREHFYPQMYGTPDHLFFWAISGISYLAFCLAAGLGAVIALSALEFIRFNGYRLYKLRKLRQGAAEALAANE